MVSGAAVENAPPGRLPWQGDDQLILLLYAAYFEVLHLMRRRFPLPLGLTDVAAGSEGHSAGHMLVVLLSLLCLQILSTWFTKSSTWDHH